MNDTLVIYFSKSGNTKKVAEYIAGEINAQTHQITTEKTYPKSYVMTIAESVKEFRKNERLVLTDERIANFSDYKNILIGFPIWCFTCPMAVVSFLEKYDFSGKKIYPFCTSGGSGCDKATAKIREICKGADVHDGIKANTLDKSRISEWLKDLN